MQLVQSRLRRVDIYTVSAEDSDYIGTKPVPKLLGYVYADIQPVSSKLFEGRDGKSEKQSVKLILRPDAGVKCGDLAAVYSDLPDFEVTEVKFFSNHISATAVRL
ncbi:MAG: hypothetical protein IJ385_04365 [Ruminiclostridium sp.]|nr:hypothetical protein [Ruminiclostridium sp.]